MKKFTLPDLRQGKPQVFSSYVFNQKAYYFKFVWSDSFCLADIYIPKDKGNLYIIKGYPLVPDVDLISRVNNPELISGKLFVKNKFGRDIVPDKNNFSTDFELVYFDESE
ncbi:hypothetical protein IKP85_04945 [bacterium]|nr:hypothetical protein [bacterium]